MLIAHIVIMGVTALMPAASAATYYVSADGSDANDGASPERAWRSLDKVNMAALEPGDHVLFRRGDQWRGSLHPRSGAEGAPVLYGAYGEGTKPVLMCSVDKSRPEDWTHEGGNLWVAGRLPEPPEGTLAPPDAPGAVTQWGLHREGGAEATTTAPPPDVGETSPGALAVACAAPGRAGHQIQLITTGLHIEAGRTYRLSFRARSSAPFSLGMPRLMMAGAPWTGYSSGPELRRGRIEDDWRIFIQHYTANTTSDNARLTFFLGGVLPEGAVLVLDNVNFSECPEDELPREEPGALPVDVGNIIFGDEDECGVKVWNKEDLTAQGQYWYDEDARVVYVYSEQNPSARYGRVECALRRHIINQGNRSWVIYENLWLRYGAAHGIGGGNTAHTIIRDCDFSYIGGGDQYGGGRTVRFGNAVEFWGNAHDHLVERCRFWEIYDAALTNQSGGAVVRQFNIIYRNNVIWNSEYSFEYWNRPEASETFNIQFINNTCVNAGWGWGHTQRADPSGRHLCFYNSPAQARDIIIRNNIFFEARRNAFFAPGWPREAVESLVMDNNIWQQAEGVMIAVAGQSYTMEQFDAYRQEFGLEANSLVGDPLFADAARLDFRLTAPSPCRDAGMDAGVTRDFVGMPVPQGARPDIGAFEFVGGAQ